MMREEGGRKKERGEEERAVSVWLSSFLRTLLACLPSFPSLFLQASFLLL
jgi:hypothetical protein